MKNKPITEKYYSKFIESGKEFDNKIVDRLDYTFKTIFSSQGFELSNWYLDEARESEIGNIREIFCEDYICFGALTYEVNTKSFISEDVKKFYILTNRDSNKKWNLLSKIPLWWLFENFEQELKDGLELYQNKAKLAKEHNKKKRAEKRLKKEKLIESAKLKLTIDEQKAVGILKK
jgi:hypothetical protein